MNFVYRFGDRTSFKAGWGKFYQTQGIHMMNVLDGDDRYYPAELSEHIVAGLEHELKNGISLRIEFYVKNLSKIRPKYYKLGDPVDLTPETGHGRFRLEPESGESSGFEIYIRKDNGGKHSWWFNYSNSDVHDVIDGIKVPRNLDQPHTVNLDYNYRPGQNWSFNLSWHYHSGWPYTQETIKFTQYESGYLWDYSYDMLNRGRYPSYHRMDARVCRYFKTNLGRLSTFLEVRNLYNRKNVREYDYEVAEIRPPYTYSLTREAEYWMLLIPSFGISMDFER